MVIRKTVTGKAVTGNAVTCDEKKMETGARIQETGEKRRVSIFWFLFTR